MSGQPFRFLHAAEFQLDRPCDGLAEVPDHLLDILVDAPYLAAQRVLETAVAQRVACVLLNGDLLGDAEPSARAYAFLRGQFQQYHECGIEVCWVHDNAPGIATWPTEVPLPPNVHLLSGDAVQAVPIQVGAEVVATVLGTGNRKCSPAAYAATADLRPGGLAIALTPGCIKTNAVVALPISYWGCIGNDQHTTTRDTVPVIHDPGPTQGRRSGQSGPHGCTVVDVSGDMGVQTRLVACDQLRWHVERETLSGEQDIAGWKRVLGERMEELRKLVPDVPLLIEWQLEIVGGSQSAAARQEAIDELAGWLRDEFGHGQPPCWSAAVRLQEAELDLDTWRDEDSLLGDYLRAAAEHQDDPELLTRFVRLAPPETRAILESWSNSNDPQTRQRLIQEAAALGAALLHGDHWL